MADIYNFYKLPQTTRSQMVLEKGTFLCKRHLGDNKIMLFFMEGLYVEVWYCFSLKKVIMVNAYENDYCINAYLDKINIEELFR
ncbi:hypothetical protein BH23BAC1_BH23BAC1_29870 [soil metagenome]